MGTRGGDTGPFPKYIFQFSDWKEVGRGGVINIRRTTVLKTWKFMKSAVR